MLLRQQLGVDQCTTSTPVAFGHSSRCPVPASHVSKLSGRQTNALIPTPRQCATLLQTNGKLYHTAKRRGVRVKSAAVEEDLMQYKDRDQWYVAKFCADDQPDWNPASVLSNKELAPGVRQVTLEVEISREKVPLRNAYRFVGQRAAVRVNNGADIEVAVATAPFPQSLNKYALLKVRGDIFAGETKTKVEEISVKTPLSLLVAKGEDADLYNIAPGDKIDIGPFQGSGLDLRGSILNIHSFVTVVIFCEGLGIGTAKALIEATADVTGLNFPWRQTVRMYYRAPNQEALCYKDLFDKWKTDFNCEVITATSDTFLDMFDNDDTLVYDPESTAAVILVGGDEDAENAALEVCEEAGIEVIVKDSEEQERTEFL